MSNKLFTRDFTLLWLGKSVSQLGDGAGFIGLMWWVQSQTGSATALGLMAAVSTIIRVLLAPFSGALADRVSKKMLIVGMDMLRGLLYCILAYLAYTSQLTLALVIMLSAANTVCSVFFGPAISATIPLLVEKDNLPRANSFLQMTGIVVQIVSFTAGGILVALIGVPMLLLVDGISFILSAVSELFIMIPSITALAAKRGNQLMANVKEGFVYVKKNQVLYEIMKTAAVLNFIAAPMFILLPKFVAEHLNASAEAYGYLLACMAAGTFMASLVVAFTKIVQGNVGLVMHGITVQSLLFVLLVLIPTKTYYLHLVILLASGFMNGIVNIYFGSLMQRIVAKEHMGKVFGLLEAMSGAVQPLSQGLTGFIGDRLPVGIIYIATGGLGALGGIKFSLIPNLRVWLNPEQETANPKHEVADPAING